MIHLPKLRTAHLTGKRVFLRADLDTPLSKYAHTHGKRLVADDTRLVAGLETIEYLLEHSKEVVIGGHLRRPEGFDKSLSLEPVAQWFVEKFKIHSSEFKVGKLGEFEGWKIGEKMFLLENLRFYKEEKEDSSRSSGAEFAKKLSSLADIYVNDAFASSHRVHVSIVGIPKFLPSYAGFRLQKEVEVLSKIILDSQRPLVVLIGGAKIETKIPLIEKMHHLADYVLIGGKIAKETRTIIHIQHEKVKERKSILLVAELNSEETDITPKSVENFMQILQLAKTIVWNGPLGKTENGEDEIKKSRIGTWRIAEAIVKSGAYSVVGGGDTLEFLKKIHLLEKFSFFSTGGGAMLAFLSGEKLPGIEALMR